jgi:hypothetical protein
MGAKKAGSANDWRLVTGRQIAVGFVMDHQ